MHSPLLSELFPQSLQKCRTNFCKSINPGAYILDFGCGAGRDTKYFLDQGYLVEAIDGSEQLCQIASKHTGIKVRQMLFQELKVNEKYDGIWACASILHLPKKELKEVFKKMLTALKPGGRIYTSFKYGEYEGEQKRTILYRFYNRHICGFCTGDTQSANRRTLDHRRCPTGKR